MKKVLKIEDLKVGIKGKKSITYPIQNVSFDINVGESLALVGESGSGKSMTAMSIMGLLRSWNSHLNTEIDGKIEFTTKTGKTHQLTEIDDKAYDLIRGKDLSIIFQEPLYALNPVISIGKQIGEVLLAHEKISKREIEQKVISLLKRVGIPEPENRMHDFPHQFSGGQLQRVMIAMSIACDTSCLIADEPTTALDVTIQKQILNLLKQLQKEENLSILLITHDLGVVSQFADKVAVMFAGTIVEYGYVEKVFKNPIHPYTKLLLESIPTLETEPGVRLRTKKDFLSDNGKKMGELVFDPDYRQENYHLKLIEKEHYVSNSFTREVSV